MLTIILWIKTAAYVSSNEGCESIADNKNRDNCPPSEMEQSDHVQSWNSANADIFLSLLLFEDCCVTTFSLLVTSENLYYSAVVTFLLRKELHTRWYVYSVPWVKIGFLVDDKKSTLFSVCACTQLVVTHVVPVPRFKSHYLHYFTTCSCRMWLYNLTNCAKGMFGKTFFHLPMHLGRISLYALLY